MDNIQEQPLISIIMPAHNAAAFIESSILSVLAQSYPNWELLVIDDASSDETAEIVKTFTDPRIKLRQVERIGHPAGVRNIGLSLAQGNFISFLDADDLYLPEALEKLLSFLQTNHQATAVYGFSAAMDEKSNPMPSYDILKSSLDGTYKLPDYYKHGWELILLSKISCLLPALMLRRETFERVGFFNENLCGPEDYEFYIRLFIDNFDEVHYLPEHIYRYRIYGGSLTKAPEHYKRILESLLNIMQWFFSQSNLPKKVYKLKSIAYTECYRYLSRERLIHRQINLCQKIAIRAFKDSNVELSDWLHKIFPILIRSFIPSALNDLLITVKWSLKNRNFLLFPRLSKGIRS